MRRSRLPLLVLLAPVVLAAAGCHAGARVRVPALAVHADARVQARARVDTVVELEGAPVVEFFGVPLEGAQDVVFVLDRSGSMAQPAQGRIAHLGKPAPAAQAAPATPTAQPAGPTAQAATPGAQAATPGAQPATPGAQPAPTAQAAPAVQRTRKIDVAQSELVDALQKLPDGTRMNVVFFNDELEAFAPSMVPLDPADRDGLVAFVTGTTPERSTALAPAMRVALLMNARRVVLLSDGLGNVGGDAETVLRDAREAIRGGVRIDTIGLGPDQDAALLRALADESGGLYQAL